MNPSLPPLTPAQAKKNRKLKNSLIYVRTTCVVILCFPLKVLGFANKNQTTYIFRQPIFSGMVWCYFTPLVALCKTCWNAWIWYHTIMDIRIISCENLHNIYNTWYMYSRSLSITRVAVWNRIHSWTLHFHTSFGPTHAAWLQSAPCDPILVFEYWSTSASAVAHDWSPGTTHPWTPEPIARPLSCYCPRNKSLYSYLGPTTSRNIHL